MKLYVLAVLASVALAQNDCNDFKSKCQTACIAHSNGVSTNQCWGSPRYRLCKCSDATVLNIPGYTCDHPTCPGGNNGYVSGNSPTALTPPPAPPTPRPTPAPLCSFCGTKPAVSGLSAWEIGTSADGTQVKTLSNANNNVVVCAESHNYAYASFTMANPGKSYATIDVALKNRAEAANGLTLTQNGAYSADISAANAIVLTYQSSADMYLQIRHAGNKHGGHHYRVLLPAHPTMATANLPFSAFKQPSWAASKYALDLTDVFSFTFVATQNGAMLVHSLVLSKNDGNTMLPTPAASAACTVNTAKCPWQQGNRCLSKRPAIAGAVATTTTAPSASTVQGHVEKAAREAVRIKSSAQRVYAFHSLLSGTEKRVQGYNYQIKMLVSSNGETLTVDAVVATTTNRDIYRIVSWAEVGHGGVGGTGSGGDVYAQKPGGDVYAQKPGGDVYAQKPGGDVYAQKPGGDVYAQRPGGDVYAQRPTMPVSAGGVAGHAHGVVITPQGDARAVYNTPYKARGQMFPFITEDGECVDISPPWPKGYMPCCPGCHSRPCNSCFKQPSGHYVPM